MSSASSALQRAPDARFGARAIFAGVALALVAVPFGLLLFLIEDHWSPLARVDGGARDDLHAVALHHDALVTALKVLSTIGSAVVYFPLFAAIAAWLAWRRLPRLALFVVVTVAGSARAERAREARRPPGAPRRDRSGRARPNGLSFPSGHAQGAIVASAVLLLVFLPLLRGRWRALAVALAVAFTLAIASPFTLAIGLARITLGVHYLSDVLAGYVLGAAWVAAMIAVFNAWRRDSGRPAVDPAHGLEAHHASRLGGAAPLRRDPPGSSPRRSPRTEAAARPIASIF